VRFVGVDGGEGVGRDRRWAGLERGDGGEHVGVGAARLDGVEPDALVG